MWLSMPFHRVHDEVLQSRCVALERDHRAAELAPGRFVLGIGASSENIVQAWSGIPFRRPLGRVRETVTLVRSILSGERTAFEGSTVRSQGYRLLMKTPSPPIPIHVGALMPPMLEVAGEVGDGVTWEIGDDVIAMTEPMSPRRGAYAEHVVVTAERIVDHIGEKDAQGTFIPGIHVDSVVHAPFGAHPGGCTGFYGQDKIHMRDYVIASKDDESFAEYIRAHVFEVQNHADYIERFVPLDWRQPARAAGA